MAHSAPSRPRSRRASALRGLLAVVLVLAGATVAGWQIYRSTATPSASRTPTGGGSTPTVSPSPSTSHSPVAARSSSPSAVTTPAAVVRPELWQQSLPPAVPVLSPAAAPTGAGGLPTADGLEATIGPLLADPVLATDQVGVVVADAATATAVFSRGGSTALVPASTAKLATAVAALSVVGGAQRQVTNVVAGPTADQIVLVGGGDPTLAGTWSQTAAPSFPAPATLADLARETATALRATGTSTVTLGYDASLFSGPSTASGWKPLYVSEGDVAPVSALEVDEGRSAGKTRSGSPITARVADPAAVAAAQFSALLAADGITVSGSAKPMHAGSGAAVASVSSAPVGALVQHMLGHSDNDLAEALARHVALARGGAGSFVGGAKAVQAAAAALGVAASAMAMTDASGLSPDDRIEPVLLAQFVRLAVAPGHPELAAILSGLPVAGFSGTLENRFKDSAAAGVVRAKTGTLDGVVSLAGYAIDASGRTLVFAIVANAVNPPATVATEKALDAVAAGIASCGCR
jgi:D-alanyl-D-alanine carboxypeptidase/D-alanyl-D-alanine-endopeptidase (penicillin-binding protein 4)